MARDVDAGGEKPFARNFADSCVGRRWRLALQAAVARLRQAGRILCVLALLSWALPAAASHDWTGTHDHIVERHWAEDPSGRLDLAQAQALPAKPFEGVLSAGFGTSALWLRLRIDPSVHPHGRSDQPDRLVLRFRPVYLDSIEVFDPAVSSAAVTRVGDRWHPRQDLMEGLDFLVPIARGQAPRDVWVRLVSTSTRQVHVQALSVDDLERQTRLQELVFSANVGVILVFVIWGLVASVFLRELLILAFSLKQFGALCFALASLGYLRSLWPSTWDARVLDGLTSFFSIFAVSAAILFHILFIRECGVPRWLTRVHLVVLALFPLKMVMLAGGWEMRALELNMIEVLLAPLMFLVSALLARGWEAGSGHRPALSRPVVVGFYGLLLAVMLAASLPALGIRSGGGEVALYIVQAHGLITALLILVMLQYRHYVRARQQQQTLISLERVRVEARQERTVRQEQEKLLDMLAHELKTPLATMQLRIDEHAAGSREVRRAIRDMTSVIDRCVQANQFGDKKLLPVPRPCDMADVVRDAVASCSQPERIRCRIEGRIPMDTDPQLLFIVLSNLLENACKYADPGTEVDLTLSTDPQAAQVRLLLANRPGQAGWPEPGRLFEKYYRSPQARRHSGTGLGLYLVRHLVEVLGGRIDYAPDAEHVRFVVHLPVRAAAAVPALA